jgi:hypothetical protein
MGVRSAGTAPAPWWGRGEHRQAARLGQPAWCAQPRSASRPTTPAPSRCPSPRPRNGGRRASSPPLALRPLARRLGVLGHRQPRLHTRAGGRWLPRLPRHRVPRLFLAAICSNTAEAHHAIFAMIFRMRYAIMHPCIHRRRSRQPTRGGGRNWDREAQLTQTSRLGFLLPKTPDLEAGVLPTAPNNPDLQAGFTVA